MESALDWHSARALLEWQVDLGVTEAICDVPLNRFEAPETLKPVQATQAPAQPVAAPTVDPVAEARAAAQQAGSLEALQEAMAAFEHCELKKGARNLVFADGRVQARVMIIGEAPGRDEDLAGRPFVGRAGQLLDKMLAAIGMGRDAANAESAVYITNVLPWRPPQNRDPKPEEIAMMRPFVERHVELIDPDLVILMGNISCEAGLRKRGILRLRGTWAEAYGRPALPMTHPAYLLRQPQAKREAWADLLSLQAKLRALG